MVFSFWSVWTVTALFFKKKGQLTFNSLPNNKILDRSKLKALTNDKMNFTEQIKFV